MLGESAEEDFKKELWLWKSLTLLPWEVVGDYISFGAWKMRDLREIKECKKLNIV